MESNNLNKISINIPNYNGPLEVLLELAKSQKVDLAKISKLDVSFLTFLYILLNGLIEGYSSGLSMTAIISVSTASQSIDIISLAYN